MTTANPRPETTTTPSSRSILLTRIIDAPRQAVFDAWTKPDLMKKWFGPNGFTVPFCKIDPRVGGIIQSCMRSPDGRDFWSKCVIRELVPAERLVYNDSFADEEGNVVPATDYGMGPGWPKETLVTVTFAEEGRKTKLTLQHEGIPAGKDRDQCETGWKETLGRLDSAIAKA